MDLEKLMRIAHYRLTQMEDEFEKHKSSMWIQDRKETESRIWALKEMMSLFSLYQIVNTLDDVKARVKL